MKLVKCDELIKLHEALHRTSLSPQFYRIYFFTNHPKMTISKLDPGLFIHCTIYCKYLSAGTINYSTIGVYRTIEQFKIDSETTTMEPSM